MLKDAQILIMRISILINAKVVISAAKSVILEIKLIVSIV